MAIKRPVQPKGPGGNQLGHSPMSKVKLEGPKRHHDDHGTTDSVPAKGSKRAVPNEHWERIYMDDLAVDTLTQTGAEFNPMLAKHRTCTHTKVNEEDH